MADISVNTSNIVSSEEMAFIIQTTVESLLSNPDNINAIPAIMLRGAPGVGKSTIVKSVAEKLNIGFIDVRLAQMERVDFAGLPSVDPNTGITEWNIPAFWPRKKESSGIILLDEITSAPSDVQVAAYSLILDRRIPNTNYVIPKGWLIIAAGNRAVDRAVVKTMSSALANRFVHFDIDPNVEDWAKWATRNSIEPSVLGFINYRPGLLFKMEGQNLEQGWPSPRSWERVSSSIKMFGGNIEILRKMVYGLVGSGAGIEFMEFFKLQSEIENVINIMLDPSIKDFEIPAKSDQKYAMASAAVYHLWNGTKEETPTRISGFFKILMKMPNDFATLMIKLALLGNKNVTSIDALSMIMSAPEYAISLKKFETAFSQAYTSF